MFYLNHSFTYDIFVHDTDYFVLNINPMGLPSISKGVNCICPFTQPIQLLMQQKKEMPNDEYRIQLIWAINQVLTQTQR